MKLKNEKNNVHMKCKQIQSQNQVLCESSNIVQIKPIVSDFKCIKQPETLQYMRPTVRNTIRMLVVRNLRLHRLKHRTFYVAWILFKCKTLLINGCVFEILEFMTFVWKMLQCPNFEQNIQNLWYLINLFSKGENLVVKTE